MKHLIETRVKYSAGSYSVRICGKTALSTLSAETAIRRAIGKKGDGMIDRLAGIERMGEMDAHGWGKFVVTFSDAPSA